MFGSVPPKLQIRKLGDDFLSWNFIVVDEISFEPVDFDPIRRVQLENVQSIRHPPGSTTTVRAPFRIEKQ